MKILVTGGAGYIGSHVVLDLIDSGHEVIVFDDLSLGRKENIHPDAGFILGNTLDPSALEKAFSFKPEAVIHLAAWKAAGESMILPQKYAWNNLAGTFRLLETMLRHNVLHLVFSSTAAVYGYPRYLPIDEDHPLEPINYYGFTKLDIERNLEWYSKLKGLRYAALRYFNAAGYDLNGRIRGKEKNPANLIPVVMEVANGSRESMDVFGNDYNTRDGTGIRDYIHVSDLGSAHLKALDYITESGRDMVVNLATGTGFSVLEVIESVKEITGQTVNYRITGRRPGDPAELIAVSQTASELLNWKPVHSDLETLIGSTWNIYRNN